MNKEQLEKRMKQVQTDINALRDKYTDITEMSKSQANLYVQLLEEERFLVGGADLDTTEPPAILYDTQGRKFEITERSKFYEEIEELIYSPFHYMEHTHGWAKGIIGPIRPGTIFLFSPGSEYRIIDCVPQENGWLQRTREYFTKKKS